MIARHEEQVERIVFRWDPSNELGTTGFGPVAWSCGRNQVEALFNGVGSLLRARGGRTVPALIRLERPDSCLLIGRLPWRGADGRTDTVCLALLGAPRVLDADTCLGLHSWLWKGGDLPLGEITGTLDPLPVGPLLAAADDGRRALAQDLAEAERPLIGLTAELLRRPRGLFTALERQGGIRPLQLLSGLYGIFRDTLPRWTYATHNTAEAELLRFQFVDSWSTSAAPDTQRTRTDPEEWVGDGDEELAAALVAHHLRDVARGEQQEYVVANALEAAFARHRERSGPAAVLRNAAEDALLSLERDGHAQRQARDTMDRPRSEQTRQDPPASETYETAWKTYDTPAAYGTAEETYSAQETYESEPRPHTAQSPNAELTIPHVEPTTPHPHTASAAHNVQAEAAIGPPSVPAAPDLRPVLPDWRAPARGSGHAWWQLRWPGKASTDRQVLAALKSLDHPYVGGKERVQAVVRDAGDSDLLDALREDLHYDAVTLILGEIAWRWGWWGPPLREALCDVVLEMDLFLTHHCGPGTRGYPGDQLQASNAAELYRWAVRPSADTQRAYTVLVELLPRIGFGPERVGRAAVCQILEGEGGPGLVEPVWLALLDAARAAPPHQPAPMEPPPSGRTPTPALVHEPPRQLGPHRMPTAPQTQPLPPAPQAGGGPQSLSTAGDATPNDGRLFVMLSVGALAVLIVALVILLIFRVAQ